CAKFLNVYSGGLDVW
nr:immunoglobulin heavy chain junction region [Macaca mulatta]